MQRLAWLGCVTMLCALAHGGEEIRRTISVSGEALLKVAPDQVTITVGVETFNKALDAAQAANAEACKNVIRAVKELGVEDKHLQTDNLEVEIKYRSVEHPSEGIEGYFARRSYAITLKDIKLFEKTVDAALKNGANRLMGFEYQTSDLRKHRDEARKKAINAAKEKATALLAELNCKVGKPLSVSEGYNNAWWPTRSWGGGYRGQLTQNVMQNVEGGGGGGGEGDLPVGQMGVRANVSVVFEIEL